MLVRIVDAAAFNVEYAAISAVVELTPLVVAGSVRVTVVPTAPGPVSIISMMSSILLPISVDAPAEPAVSIYLGIADCNGTNEPPVTILCILVFKNSIVPNVADLIEAGINAGAIVLSALSPSK